MLADAGLTVTEATGTVVTVRVAVPLWPSLVAVIVADPTALVVTKPLALTAATAALFDAQVTTRPASGPPVESLGTAVSCVDLPTVIVADEGVTVTEATGARVTVRVAVADRLSLVATIVVLPVDTPTPRPLALTVATAGLLLTQVTTRPASGLPAESNGAAMNCCAPPTNMSAVVGDRVSDATDTELTVTVAESATVPGLARALTLYWPGAVGAWYRPRWRPPPMGISVTLPPVVVHIISVLAVSPAASRATAYKSALWFAGRTTVDGEMMILDA